MLGSPDALRTLLRLNAPQALLYAISTFPPLESMVLKAALTRALRAIAAATADIVGPSQWGLATSVSDLRAEAKAALDYLFQVRTLLSYFNFSSQFLCDSQRSWMYTFLSSWISRPK